jgi:sorbitol-specific phosphotransferase system component IIC
MIAAIDFGKLFELVWAAALAGLVVSGAFATALVGFTRAGESRQRGTRAAATAYVVLGLVGTVVFLGAMAFGVEVIVAK